MEIENNDYLPFLDLKIIKNNKLEFGIFRKDTHADNYIKAIATILLPINKL